ncbi:MAG TPA: glutamate--tRNA ligase [Terriglobales bacterium]|nr:glutamate--tRNA ligase [Terriglobales bacterium]
MYNQVRVRIAPSPSGYLHVGTARIAVCNWLFARHNQGKFILRIEDTDITRSDPRMVEVILESLKWLGLDWDEGPYYQSQRMELYKRYAQVLLEKNKAYYCYCTPETLKRKREEAAQKKINWVYDRTCLKLSEQEKAELESKNTPKAMRIFIPEGETSFYDIVYKDLKKENKELDDFVILRSDFRPTYNFAVVVDDLDMRITHVIRGNDHLANTFKQVLLYRALDEMMPAFAHLPLNLAMDRQKISKRKGAVAITDYRDAGYLPEVMVNFLAISGWSPKDEREIMSREELVQSYSLEGVSQANPIFDMQKLEWMNGEYIRAYDNERLVDEVIPFLIRENLMIPETVKDTRGWLLKYVVLFKERAKTLKEFAEKGKYLFAFDYQYDPKAVSKTFNSAEVADRLGQFVEKISVLDEFKKDKIEETLRKTADDLKIEPAPLIHAVRLATTGVAGGPPLFDILELLGKEEVEKRIKKAVEFIKAERKGYS